MSDNEIKEEGIYIYVLKKKNKNINSFFIISFGLVEIFFS